MKVGIPSCGGFYDGNGTDRRRRISHRGIGSGSRECAGGGRAVGRGIVGDQAGGDISSRNDITARTGCAGTHCQRRAAQLTVATLRPLR